MELREAQRQDDVRGAALRLAEEKERFYRNRWRVMSELEVWFQVATLHTTVKDGKLKLLRERAEVVEESPACMAWLRVEDRHEEARQKELLARPGNSSPPGGGGGEEEGRRYVMTCVIQ